MLTHLRGLNITLLAVLGGFTLLCYLGYWQLDRAQQKEALQNHQQAAQQHHALKNNDLLRVSNTTAWRYRPVKLTGSFLNNYSILLDNKIKNGQAGYDLYTPFAIDPQTVVLINRGWIPVGPNRKTIPPIVPIVGNVVIEGYLDIAYRNPFVSTALETPVITWPLRMQYLDITVLSTSLKKVVYPMSVEFENKSAGWLNPQRHRGYAVQWFGLAIALVVFYCCTQLSRVRKA